MFEVKYSRTSPYGHLYVRDSSFGPRETRVHMISTFKYGHPTQLWPFGVRRYYNDEVG